MSDRRTPPCPRDPIGLSREAAASYIGVSPATFDKLVDDHLMPGPRAVRGRLVWHAGEVEQAFLRLPVARGLAPDDAMSVWEKIQA